jgi:phospholipid-binding lipoprotein MlaA
MKRDDGQQVRSLFSAMKFFAVAIGVAFLLTGAVHAEESATAPENAGSAEPQQEAIVLAQTAGQAEPVAAIGVAGALAASAGEDFEDDPFEGFNEKMFWFNREVLDRYLLKPLATGWDFILPDPVQRGVHNFFDNLSVVRRVVNNSLQAKFGGAGIELARFGINSTIGLVGFFDVAKDAFGIEQRDEDTGQTFGVWGIAQGPYLILPFFPPLTIRDGIGYAFDAAMTPYTYFIPWWGTIAGTATNTVNERSLNLDRFERVAESTVDLYGAVRNAYLQRRAAAVKQ